MREQRQERSHRDPPDMGLSNPIPEVRVAGRRVQLNWYFSAHRLETSGGKKPESFAAATRAVRVTAYRGFRNLPSRKLHRPQSHLSWSM